jgi:alpha-L-fucosidase 2
VQEKGKLSPDNFLAPNLINRSYQLEGPWGFTAGIAEMLLQSHISGTGFQPVVSANPTLGQDAQATHEIHLLPALPKAWPTGQVTGLRARGNFTVDIEWKDGKVTSYRIASPEPREVKVRANGETKTIRSEKI